MKPIDGPIPGENYTSDTKNYPWHRPPEFTDMEKALDMSAKKMMKKEAAIGILTLLEGGASIAAVADMFVTSGIGSGKWTPDFAILMAGPIARMIELMAKGAKIEYRVGIEEDFKPSTIHFFNGLKDISSGDAKKAIDALNEQKDTVSSPDPQKPTGTSFMSPNEEGIM